MRFTIFPNNPSTVQGKVDGDILHADIKNDLIKGTLQERGIDGHHGIQAFQGHPGGKGDGMLFCNSHVVEAFRKFFLKPVQPRSTGHGSGNGNNGRIIPGQFHKGSTEYFCISGLLFRHGLAGFDIEFPDAVEFRGKILSGGISFTFLSHDMNKNWA